MTAEEDLLPTPPSNNNKHAHFAAVATTNTPHSSSDDDDDDEATRERMRAFQKSSTRNIGATTTTTTTTSAATTTSLGSGSIRRFDEYKDFITRSERTRSHRPSSESTLPTQQEQQESRKVQFHDPSQNTTLELEELEDPNLHSKLYMTIDNWQAIDLDIELTRKRWQNHVEGRLPFDANNNTIRGLEGMVDEEYAEERDVGMHQHRQAVLREQNRQRTCQCHNLEAMRKVSLQHESMAIAIQRAQNDWKESIECWKSSTSPTTTGGRPSTTKTTTKKKNFLGGLFQRK